MNAATPLDLASEHLSRGWQPVPIPLKSKKPIGKEWQLRRLTPDTLAAHFNGKPMNVGVLLGEPSGWLIDADLDTPEACRLADLFLPPTPCWFGRPGKPGSHRLYIARGLDAIKFQHRQRHAGGKSKALTVLELRSTGGQTVFPGSVHESGERITWHDPSDPAEVDPGELRQAAADLAAASLLARFWPGKAGDGDGGCRHDASLALAGFLCRGGIEQERAERIMRGIATATGADDPQVKVANVRSTYAKAEAGEKFTGRARLIAFIEEKAVDKAGEWLEVQRGLIFGPGPDDGSILGTPTPGDDFIGSAWDHAKRADADTGEAEAGETKNPRGLILDRGNPRHTAKKFIKERLRGDGGARLLHYWRGDWWRWNGSHYAAAEPVAVRGEISAYTERAKVWVKRGDALELEEFKPTKSRTDNITDAMQQLTHLPADADAPRWLDGRDTPNPAELLPCRNGVLHLPDAALLPHDPLLFTTGGLDYDFDPTAGEPREWLAFLNQLWPGDPESIDTLQRWFGYLLTNETAQQKALMLIGPKRSGKGTIARVLTRLIGPANVASPTLSSLTTNFGLWPLIGKGLATISDARLSGRADQAVIVERLLSVTGEDFITIDRKNQQQITVKLPTRFMLLSNELPRLGDSSGALASRFIVLRLEQSFYGNEDHGLTERLLAELPGILLWAMDGWSDLQERGRFDQPATAADLIEELSDLSSPISAFIRDRCRVDAAEDVSIDTLYRAWRRWCDDEGRDHPGTKQWFSKDLRAAVPSLATVQRRVGGGERERFFAGIGLVYS